MAMMVHRALWGISSGSITWNQRRARRQLLGLMFQRRIPSSRSTHLDALVVQIVDEDFPFPLLLLNLAALIPVQIKSHRNAN